MCHTITLSCPIASWDFTCRLHGQQPTSPPGSGTGGLGKMRRGTRLQQAFPDHHSRDECPDLENPTLRAESHVWAPFAAQVIRTFFPHPHLAPPLLPLAHCRLHYSSSPPNRPATPVAAATAASYTSPSCSAEPNTQKKRSKYPKTLNPY